MYDLEEQLTEKQIRDFRIKIIRKGFTKLQDSIYYKYYKNIILSSYTITSIMKNTNEYYNIKFIHLTLKQFIKMNNNSSHPVDISKLTSNIVIC